ncbi:hypothetical protein KKC91_11915 [bacterium]|nr:hypothetical protein [bacterium]MBU1852668.1 hypothetical protein [Candidatus Omnitrophota bacterium]
MKRFLAGILVLFVFSGFTVQAQAAESDVVTVRVSILASLSVDITETEVDLGSVSAGSTTVSSFGVTVTNTGSGIDETYSLSLVDPSGWSASQSAAGVDTYVLNASFDSDGVLTWDVTDHALSTTPVVCTGSVFAGDQTGVSVPQGGVRSLWFQFLAPTATSVSEEQGIMVTITAQVS